MASKNDDSVPIPRGRLIAGTPPASTGRREVLQVPPPLPDQSTATGRPKTDAKCPPPPPVSTVTPAAANVISELESGNDEIKRVASGLNERIRRAEDWIAKVPGRVTTYVEMTDPYDGPEWTFHLRVTGGGDKWQLQFQYQNERHGLDEDAEWQALKDASIETKMAGLRALPLLFEQMRKAQLQFIEKMRDAQAVFDHFAESVGMPAKVER